MNKYYLNLLHTCNKSIRDYDCILIINDILQTDSIRRKINLELKISNYNNKKRELFDIILHIVIGILYINKYKLKGKLIQKIKYIESVLKNIFNQNWDLNIYRNFDTYLSYDEQYQFSYFMKNQQINYSNEIINNKILLSKFFLSILCEGLWFMCNRHNLCKNDLEKVNSKFYMKKIEKYGYCQFYINQPIFNI